MSASGRRRAPCVVNLMMITAVAVLASAPTSAQTVVQSFDPLRDGPPNPFATLGFISSPCYRSVQAAAAANLGVSIMFGTPEHPGGVSAVTPEVLAGTDIFVVTGMNLALSADEACLLDGCVAGGAAVFAFRNEWMPTRLLGTALDGFGGTGYAQVSDPASPLVAGPFGLVVSPVRVGANSGYTADAAGLDALQGCAMPSGPETPGGDLPMVGDTPSDSGEPADLDHDGVPAGRGCDDLDAAAHPGAVDLPGNPVDENCDGAPACDPGAVWNSHGDFVSCVAREASALVADKAISLEQGRALIRAAARGESGRPTGRASSRDRR